MRRPAVLLPVAAALGIALTTPAQAASAPAARTEVICQDWSAYPQYIRHIFLTPDNPTGTRDFDEHPEILTCYQWSGSTPATVAYTISYVQNGVDHPDGATGTFIMGRGLVWGTATPGYVYRASFALVP